MLKFNDKDTRTTPLAEAQFMKQLSNTEAKLKKPLLIKKECRLLTTEITLMLICLSFLGIALSVTEASVASPFTSQKVVRH